MFELFEKTTICTFNNKTKGKINGVINHLNTLCEKN